MRLRPAISFSRLSVLYAGRNSSIKGNAAFMVFERTSKLDAPYIGLIQTRDRI